MAKKCAACGEPAVWAWQPFGPGESSNCFCFPGSHYRGFPVYPLCDGCKERYSGGEIVTLKTRGAGGRHRDVHIQGEKAVWGPLY